MVDNKYKVRKDVWSKWTDAQRQMFIMVYDDIIGTGSDTFIGKNVLDDKQFKVFAWNAAWSAASVAPRCLGS